MALRALRFYHPGCIEPDPELHFTCLPRRAPSWLHDQLSWPLPCILPTTTVLARMAIFSKPARNPALVTLVASVLLLRSRLLDIPKEALAKLGSAKQKTTLDPQYLLSVLQQVYLKEDDGSKTLLVPYDEQIAKVRRNTHAARPSLTIRG